MRSTESEAGDAAAFNALGAQQAAAGLDTCLHAPGWVSAVLAGRPYRTRAELLAAAHDQGVSMVDGDLRLALSAHPRIGESPGTTGPEAAHSAAEQGGLDAGDASLAGRLRAGNLAYEAKFGHVFLIRAAGRSGPEILSALDRRLGNDPVTEAGVVREQLTAIAGLRLGAMLDRLAADGAR